ncbi:hypothetical protein BH23BAC1_BH23BAC1_49860 [soil metagenome]
MAWINFYPFWKRNEPINAWEKALILLRFAVFIQCLGFFFTTKTGTSIEGLLFMEYRLPQAQAKSIELWAGYTFLILGVAQLLWISPIIWFSLVIETFLLAWIIRQHGGNPFSDLAVLAYAVRYLTPLGLIFLLWSKKHFHNIGFWILILGLSITFITHGYEAISLHPVFLDYLITSAKNILNWNLQESTASNILRIIGFIDILMALLLVITRNKYILIWLAIWGFLTAFSRITELGWGMYPEVLVRVAHFCVPLALLLFKKVKKLDPLQYNILS